MKSNIKHLLHIIAKEVVRPSSRTFNIVLEGNIGSGKTTFLNYFKDNKLIHVDSEPLDLWLNCDGHNLLALQYKDPVKWASTLQSYIMLTMMKVHTKSLTTPVRIMERSIYSGRHCFIENMIRQNLLPPPSAAVLDKWFKYLTNTIPINIDLIVYLHTTPETVYNRMLKRDRVEESKISFEYIKQIHDIHEEWLSNPKNVPAPILFIDGNVEKFYFENELKDFYKANASKISIQ